MHKSKYIFAFIILSSFLFACKKNKTKVERAFYYWKSNEYDLSDQEEMELKFLDIQKLYVKFFEVETDSIFGTKPIAKTQLHIWNSGPQSNLNIIPTIFIKNNVFYNASHESMDTLADNIIFLINKYYKEKIHTTKSYTEIQIDCDWTKKTKDNYFYFLKAIKKLSKKNISCTLRLYPYKYPDAMGIPPVDKATLMCYNLINPLENENKNSIQDNRELESYLKSAKKYPLHLDIALPIFSWMQVYQNNHFAGIINLPKNEINDVMKQIKPLWYEVQKDMETDNLYLREGDKVKLEEVTEKSTMETISLLKDYISFDDSTTITLFHLDEANLKNYKNETISGFYTRFSN